MVLVGEKKYACETCIKGHRSSSCKHTDRPLFEIKKKGRPVTQCDHCRELRRTKQVHVKCVCEGEGLSLSKEGGKHMPASAAFPSGLPAALGASVALKPPSESSDSDYASESSTKACTCKSDGPCNCCTPRAPRNRRQSKSNAVRKSDKEDPDSGSERAHQPAGLVASAHTGDYRPVLPRPSSASRSSPPRSAHTPGGTPHGPRGQLFFSPYSRAYEYTHAADTVQASDLPNVAPVNQQILQMPQLLTNPVPPNQSSIREDVSSFMSEWLSSIQQPNLLPPPVPSVLCDCGPNCACPGCIVHQGTAAVQDGFASCVNPTTCNACLECSVLSLAQNPVVDEWFRQLNTASIDVPEVASRITTSAPTQNPFADMMQQSRQQTLQPDLRFDPSAWQSYALWNNLQGQLATPSPPEDCCGGQCKCSPGMCSCPADCCGCCQGCSCAECSHQDRSMGTGKTLTFAVSGERGACCGRRSPHHADDAQQASPSSSMPIMDSVGYQGELDLRGIYEFDSPSSEAPRTSLSRASSSSSRSSSQQSHYSSSQGSVHRGAVASADATAIKSCCASLETMNTSAGAAPLHSPIPYVPAAAPQERTYHYETDIGSARMF